MPDTKDVDLQQAWLDHPFLKEFAANEKLMRRETLAVNEAYHRTQKATEEAR
jgi:hypothetical protein